MVKSLKGFETLFIVLLLSGISLFALSQTNIRPKFNFYSANLPASLPTPAPVNISPLQKISTQSPDGKATLVMEKQKLGQETEYSFSVLNHEDNSNVFLFSKTLNNLEEISIPFNTFSPDNKDVFLKEGDTFYVWSVEGGTNPINVSQLFLEKYPDFSLLDITGWAAPDLLIVNIKNSEGTKSSYWFEVPSQNFIPLATGFY